MPRTYLASVTNILKDLLEEYLAQLNKDDITGRAKALIVDMLPSGQVTVGKVAGKLNMSIRSLQREFARHDRKDV